MWQVVYIATNKSEAQEMEKRLGIEGFLVKIEVIDDGYQIKVPELEAEDVYQFLNDNF